MLPFMHVPLLKWLKRLRLKLIMSLKLKLLFLHHPRLRRLRRVDVLAAFVAAGLRTVCCVRVLRRRAAKYGGQRGALARVGSNEFRVHVHVLHVQNVHVTVYMYRGCGCACGCGGDAESISESRTKLSSFLYIVYGIGSVIQHSI